MAKDKEASSLSSVLFFIIYYISHLNIPISFNFVIYRALNIFITNNIFTSGISSPLAIFSIHSSFAKKGILILPLFNQCPTVTLRTAVQEMSHCPVNCLSWSQIGVRTAL